MSGVPNRGDLMVADFDYDLPPELIAQTPLARRDSSRMLILERATSAISHAAIRELSNWLNPGDLLVGNNSRVLPARLLGTRAQGGGRAELLLLRSLGEGRWTALAKPARRLRPGGRIVIPAHDDRRPAAEIEILASASDGEIVIRFLDGADRNLSDYGVVPLPPYVNEILDDPERYQTVFASVPGSAAAPTAGLHLTEEFIHELKCAGIEWAEVTLHIGLDTFRPVSVERVAEHRIHEEWCAVDDDTARRVAATRERGRRVIALGTTAARTLETLGHHWAAGRAGGYAGSTRLFITPGYTWRVVDGLLTNFHLPRSTLLMMVSALAGRDAILAAYHAAIEKRYRFYSFGDAMLII